VKVRFAFAWHFAGFACGGVFLNRDSFVGRWCCQDCFAGFSAQDLGILQDFLGFDFPDVYLQAFAGIFCKGRRIFLQGFLSFVQGCL